MPVNEILAPYYMRVTYQTWASQHVATLYLGAGTVTASAQDFLHSAAVSPSNPTGSLAAYLKMVMDLFYGGIGIQQPSVSSVDLYQSVPSAPNIYLGPILPPLLASGATRGIAASYVMLSGVSVSASIRQAWKMMFFDCSLSAAPQRFVDDWSQTTSLFNPLYQAAQSGLMVTQDGYKPVLRTYNIGYNRKLARRYGRLLTP